MKIRILAAALVMGLAACSVEQTEEGDLPDIEVEGGNLPEYDVDAVDVDVNLDTTTIVVPNVDITPPRPTTGG
ncbi:MAG TPA: hypothetical protein VMN60_04745 [Longimicrobiales bacterium]|nr:hypothetical protein [Longimicrobiales bacterium]